MVIKEVLNRVDENNVKTPSKWHREAEINELNTISEITIYCTQDPTTNFR